jgi:HEAT repeat protein
MKKVVVLAVLAAGLGGCGNPEPLYEGQPLGFWVQEIEQTDKPARERAKEVLLGIRINDKRTVPMLAQSVKNGSFYAAETLGLMAPLGDDTKTAVDALNEAMQTKSGLSLRMAACRAMPKFGAGAKPAVPTLIHLLKDEIPDVRRTAAETLGRMTENAVEAVNALHYAAQNDSQPMVSQAAANALREIDPAKWGKNPPK